MRLFGVRRPGAALARDGLGRALWGRLHLIESVTIHEETKAAPGRRTPKSRSSRRRGS
jgi:hypothetical protein